MRTIVIAAALLCLGAAEPGDRAPVTAAQVAAVDALIPPASGNAAQPSREAAACVRTCRAIAKQEFGVCKNAYPGNKDLCLVVREQRFADCPSTCGAR